MAMVVILFTASIVILTALMMAVTSTATFANQVVYRQVSLAAAKSALENGKEMFDANEYFDQLDSNQDGTVDNDSNANSIPDTLEEKDMFSNASYRVTFQLTIKAGGTSADGRSKKVYGTGRVYIPASSTTARFSRDIHGEIIRSGIAAKNPSDFSPLAWYDAMCNPASSTEAGCQSGTVLREGSLSASGIATSLREERENGTYCGGAPQTGDGHFSMNRGSDCGANQKNHAAMVFNLGSSLPKGATVTGAYVQFTAAYTSSGNMTSRIRGLDVDNQANFTSSSSSQLSGVPYTTASTDWAVPGWTTVPQRGPAQQTADISAVIQEIIDRPGWSTGNNIGLITSHVTGGTSNGWRCADLDDVGLTVTYTMGSSSVPASSGEQVSIWRDRSGNGFDLAPLDSSSKPTYSVITQAPGGSAPNNKPMLSFDSSGLAAAVPLTANRTANSMTAIAVMKVYSQTNATGDGHIVSFRGSGTGDTTISPFWRHPTSGFHSTDDAATNSDMLCMAQGTNSMLEQDCRQFYFSANSDWTIGAVTSDIYENQQLFRVHGDAGPTRIYENNPITLNSPYTIAIGYNPFNSVKGARVEIAELILYDYRLNCPRIESVERYLADKWGLNDPALGSFSLYGSSGCAENNVPAF